MYQHALGSNSNITDNSMTRCVMAKIWYFTTKKTASFACFEIGCSLSIFNLCIQGVFFDDAPFYFALMSLPKEKEKLANQKLLKLIWRTQRSPIRCGGARQRRPTDGETLRKNDEA
jgi:hypothetical protein